NGSVASGKVVSTDSLMIPPSFSHESNEEYEAAENDQQVLLPTPSDVIRPTGPAGSNFIKDRKAGKKSIFGTATVSSSPLVVKNFSGNDPGNPFPPDPIVAVGPNHIIGVVNTAFRIWTKDGTVQKTIDLNAWFASVGAGSAFFDPQVVYDQYAGRWVMLGGK